MKNREIHNIEKLISKLDTLPGNTKLPEFNTAWMDQSPKKELDPFTVKNEILKSRKVYNAGQLAGIAALLMVVLGAAYLVTGYDRILKQKDSVADANTQNRQMLRAIITRVNGNASIIRSNIKAGVFQGDMIRQGDRLETREGEVDIALSSGTILRLKKNSIFTLKQYDTDGVDVRTEVYLSSGSLLNKVKRINAKDSHVVHTPTAIAGVRGTSFIVSVDSGKTDISLLEGSLSVQSAASSESERILEKGEAVRVSTNVDNTEFKDIKSLENEFNTMKSSESEFNKEILAAAGDLEEASSEEELKKKYNREVIEIVRLKDGRTLNGLVISQVGLKIIFQTVDGSFVLNSKDVLDINYKEN